MKQKKYNKEKVDSLHKLVQQLSQNDSVKDDLIHFNEEANNADTADLIALVSTLSSKEDSPSRKIKALRESVISLITYQNACQITDTMERLDKTASRLTIASVFLAVIGIVIAVLQLMSN